MGRKSRLKSERRWKNRQAEKRMLKLSIKDINAILRENHKGYIEITTTMPGHVTEEEYAAMPLSDSYTSGSGFAIGYTDK